MSQLAGQLALFGSRDEVVRGWQFPPGARLHWEFAEDNISWKDVDMTEPPDLDGLPPEERQGFEDEVCEGGSCWCAAPTRYRTQPAENRRGDPA